MLSVSVLKFGKVSNKWWWYSFYQFFNPPSPPLILRDMWIRSYMSVYHSQPINSIFKRFGIQTLTTVSDWKNGSIDGNVSNF
jgi:hypothetical protein